jgi:DNA-binding NarL/FixJ family response regulator
LERSNIPFSQENGQPDEWSVAVNAFTESTKLTSSRPLRILVADDHDLIRRGLRFILEPHPEWTVCAEAATGQEAVDLTRQLHPDLVLIDIHMPGMDGLQATREILAINSQIEVLVLTIDESEEVLQAAAAAGARGIVMKSDAARDLMAALTAMGRHEPFFTPKASQIAEGRTRPLGNSVGSPGPAEITNRERDVLLLVADGYSNKEIGATLSISAKTVEGHRGNVMRKLGLRSTAELVRYAMRNHLVQP